MTLAAQHLASSLDAVRLSLHVVAACVWVGGQVVLGGLVPAVRGYGSDVTKKVAQTFARLAWPAFIVLVGTGFWNVAATDSKGTASAWHAVLGAKYGVVLIAALAVGYHTRANSPKARGISAGVGLLASLVALVLGVLLAG